MSLEAENTLIHRTSLPCDQEVMTPPSDHVLRLAAEVDVIGKIQMVLPVDDLLVRLMGILRAERRIAYETFEHDRTE